jgi:hypothetical protein
MNESSTFRSRSFEADRYFRFALRFVFFAVFFAADLVFDFAFFAMLPS